MGEACSGSAPIAEKPWTDMLTQYLLSAFLEVGPKVQGYVQSIFISTTLDGCSRSRFPEFSGEFIPSLWRRYWACRPYLEIFKGFRCQMADVNQ